MITMFHYKGRTWIRKVFTRDDKPFFIPLKTEISNKPISKSRKKMSIFLQMLKETGVDAGEAWKLRWIDLNAENKSVALHQTRIITQDDCTNIK